MDLLAALPTDLPLIVPSTVIRETRHRSLPLSNRLLQLVQDEERSVWVWWNEERRETATAGGDEDDETVNDRNDRAIRQTLHFYPEHMAKSVREKPQLILLTDDRKNRELATTEGLLASSTRDYVDGLQGEVRDRLVDLVVGGVDELEPSERRSRRIYDEVSFGMIVAI
jgi:exosome complex exonuclease DIS3/RRP44